MVKKSLFFRISFLFIVSLLSVLSLTKASAFDDQKIIEPAKVGNAQIQEVVARKLDPKAVILAKYLEQHNSPLQYHAQDFIDAANRYNLDWKLVAAISGTESTFGKFIPGGYNGWGWGVYGDQALGFKSWKDGIYTVSQGLRENYVNKGYTEPYAMNRIYASSQAWAGHVVFFMNDIEKFAAANQTEDISITVIPSNKEAATSGLLAFQ